MKTKKNAKSRKPQAVVVRTYSAGVHFGYLKSRKGKEVVLSNARRIWSWSGANSLNEIASAGVNVASSRVSVPVSENTLTEAIEVLRCTTEAARILESATWAR